MVNDPSYLGQTPGTLLDALCDDFEAAWRRGSSPDLAAYLDRVPADQQSRLCRELLVLDIEYRGKRGEHPTADEYRSRFPTYVDIVAELFADTSFSSGDASGTMTIDLGGPARSAAPAGDGHAAAAEPPGDELSMRTEPTATIGRYQILGRLGGGGMGVVYRARHTALGKIVALKLLPKLRVRDPESVRRFRREMLAVGRLEHPHIVAAHDAGEADGVHYLTMELVEGSDFSRLVKSRGPLPVPEACELIRQAASGLAYVHEQGLVHRDVKPSNLMLTVAGQVKVLDLGLALIQHADAAGDPSTSTGAAVGTVDYMAPEQTSDAHRVDRRADIYSLGCTLFDLLVGRPPFSEPEFVGMPQKMYAHAHHPPPPLGSLRPGIPAPLAHAVHRALAKNPLDRFATMDDFAAAVTPFTAGADLRRLANHAQPSEFPQTPPVPIVAAGTTPPANSAASPQLSAPSVSDDVSPPLAAAAATSPAPASRRRPSVFARSSIYPAWFACLACLALGGYWFLNGEGKGVSPSGDAGDSPHEPSERPATALPLAANSNFPSATSMADSHAREAARRAFDEPQNRATEQATRWVVAQGGFVHAYIDYVRPFKTVYIRNPSEVPSEGFTVTSVTLSGITTVDGKALENISKLRQLAQLDLADTAVSDDGLVHAAKWPALTRLDLTNTRVTDTGLDRLHACKFLAVLKLAGTQASDAGIARLKAALPKCTVER